MGDAVGKSGKRIRALFSPTGLDTGTPCQGVSGAHYASVIQNICGWESDQQQSRVLWAGKKWGDANWSVTFSIVGMCRPA